MKKILSILLCLCLLSGCTAISEIVDYYQNYGDDEAINYIKVKYDVDPTEYIDALKNFEVREKNINNTKRNEKFDKFLEDVFIEVVSDDFLTMHYTVVDYKKYGIEKPEVSMGDIEYKFNEEDYKDNLNQLAELKKFDYDKLSYSQQYDYEALEYSIYETLAELCFYKYKFIFSSDNCVPEVVINNLQDYTFYDRESIDDYFTCLNDVENYLDAALIYTKEQTKEGLYLLDSSIDYTQSCCDEFISKIEDNSLITSFNNRINEIDFITKDEKDNFIKENEEIVKSVVIPTFNKVSNELEKYRGLANYSSYALCNLDKNYAEFTYLLSGSNNDSIDETFNQLKDALKVFENEYISVYYNEDLSSQFNSSLEGNVDSFKLGDEETLEFLRNNLTSCYSDLGDIEYSVERLDPTSAPASVIAYYWPAPIDKYNQNIIRINPNNISEGVKVYSTLSHEGFSGHLYQHISYLKTKPHDFRSIISFIGYDEGFAVSASRDALGFCGVGNSIVSDCLFLEMNDYFLVYSIIDIGVNYYGWSANDIVDFFDENSNLYSFNLDSANDYRNFLIEMPGVYTRYGIGFVKFMNLRDYAAKSLDSKFDLIEYNDAILKNGPLPFNILKKAVDEYINNSK